MNALHYQGLGLILVALFVLLLAEKLRTDHWLWQPQKTRHYFVCYAIEGGRIGNMDCDVKIPLNAQRVKEIREYIEGMDAVKPNRVVITSITEIEP